MYSASQLRVPRWPQPSRFSLCPPTWVVSSRQGSPLGVAHRAQDPQQEGQARGYWHHPEEAPGVPEGVQGRGQPHSTAGKRLFWKWMSRLPWGPRFMSYFRCKW